MREGRREGRRAAEDPRVRWARVRPRFPSAERSRAPSTSGAPPAGEGPYGAVLRPGTATASATASPAKKRAAVARRPPSAPASRARSPDPGPPHRRALAPSLDVTAGDTETEIEIEVDIETVRAPAPLAILAPAGQEVPEDRDASPAPAPPAAPPSPPRLAPASPPAPLPGISALERVLCTLATRIDALEGLMTDLAEEEEGGTGSDASRSEAEGDAEEAEEEAEDKDEDEDEKGTTRQEREAEEEASKPTPPQESEAERRFRALEAELTAKIERELQMGRTRTEAPAAPPAAAFSESAPLAVASCVPDIAGPAPMSEPRGGGAEEAPGAFALDAAAPPAAVPADVPEEKRSGEGEPPAAVADVPSPRGAPPGASLATPGPLGASGAHDDDIAPAYERDDRFPLDPFSAAFREDADESFAAKHELEPSLDALGESPAFRLGLPGLFTGAAVATARVLDPIELRMDDLIKSELRSDGLSVIAEYVRRKAPEATTPEPTPAAPPSSRGPAQDPPTPPQEAPEAFPPALDAGSFRLQMAVTPEMRLALAKFEELLGSGAPAWHPLQAGGDPEAVLRSIELRRSQSRGEGASFLDHRDATATTPLSEQGEEEDEDDDDKEGPARRDRRRQMAAELLGEASPPSAEDLVLRFAAAQQHLEEVHALLVEAERVPLLRHVEALELQQQRAARLQDEARRAAEERSAERQRELTSALRAEYEGRHAELEGALRSSLHAQGLAQSQSLVAMFLEHLAKDQERRDRQLAEVAGQVQAAARAAMAEGAPVAAAQPVATTPTTAAAARPVLLRPMQPAPTPAPVVDVTTHSRDYTDTFIVPEEAEGRPMAPVLAPGAVSAALRPWAASEDGSYISEDLPVAAQGRATAGSGGSSEVWEDEAAAAGGGRAVQFRSPQPSQGSILEETAAAAGASFGASFVSFDGGVEAEDPPYLARERSMARTVHYSTDFDDDSVVDETAAGPAHRPPAAKQGAAPGRQLVARAPAPAALDGSAAESQDGSDRSRELESEAAALRALIRERERDLRALRHAQKEREVGELQRQLHAMERRMRELQDLLLQQPAPGALQTVTGGERAGPSARPPPPAAAALPPWASGEASVTESEVAEEPLPSEPRDSSRSPGESIREEGEDEGLPGGGVRSATYEETFESIGEEGSSVRATVCLCSSSSNDL